jgi:dynein heavy chain
MFEFKGAKFEFKMTCNYFITMNPNYVGCYELPNNLKALFCTVTMLVPNYALILRSPFTLLVILMLMLKLANLLLLTTYIGRYING